MKQILFIYSILLLQSSAIAQNNVSPSYSFDIRKKIEPPILNYVGELKFTDADGNKAIDANEKCALEFTLQNTGKGDGLNLKAQLSATGTTSGIKFVENTPLVNVPKAGGKQDYKIDVTSDVKTVDGELTFELEVVDPNGFNVELVSLQVNTRKLQEPAIQVVDYRLFSENGTSNLALKKPFSLELLVQNMGQGAARNVKLNLVVPENVYVTNGETNNDLGSLAPGEKRSIVLDMILNAKYAGTSLPLKATLSESYGRFSKNWEQSFALNQALAQQKIVVQANPLYATKIEQATLRSDVDKDIPEGLTQNARKYALIIGCEDYSRFQTGLDKEVNVEYAGNDAMVMAEYARKTLGYPADQVYLLIDPTASQIKQNLEKLVQAMAIEKGNAEVLFYYSGHGLPDNETKLPYIIPVDVNGNNPQEGILLTDVYQKLAKNKSAKVTVVLDACFSGGARNKELVAMKGVKVKPKIDQIPANLIIFTSSQGFESSAVYKEKQHGYFTYFMLKKLKETKGDCTFGVLSQEVSYNVQKEALKMSKTQNPDVMSGVELGENWKNLKW